MKPLQNPIVVGVLVLAALALVFRSSFGPLRDRFRSQKTQTVTTPPPAVVLETPPLNPPETNAPAQEITWRRMDIDFANFLRIPKRDPFQFVPLAGAYRMVALSNFPSLTSPIKTAQETLALNAVWMQTGSQLAVLNGQIVTEGSSILDYKVEKIEQDKVWVSGPIGQEKVEFSNFGGSTNGTATNSLSFGPPELKPGDLKH